MSRSAAGLAWLANKLNDVGARLRRGQIVLAGSFTRPVDIAQGDVIHADYGPLGAIGVHSSEVEPSRRLCGGGVGRLWHRLDAVRYRALPRRPVDRAGAIVGRRTLSGLACRCGRYLREADGRSRRIVLKNSNFCFDHNSEDRRQP